MIRWGTGRSRDLERPLVAAIKHNVQKGFGFCHGKSICKHEENINHHSLVDVSKWQVDGAAGGRSSFLGNCCLVGAVALKSAPRGGCRLRRSPHRPARSRIDSGKEPPLVGAKAQHGAKLRRKGNDNVDYLRVESNTFRGPLSQKLHQSLPKTNQEMPGLIELKYGHFHGNLQQAPAGARFLEGCPWSPSSTFLDCT